MPRQCQPRQCCSCDPPAAARQEQAGAGKGTCVSAGSGLELQAVRGYQGGASCAQQVDSKDSLYVHFWYLA
jgi:hypothetical protein